MATRPENARHGNREDVGKPRLAEAGETAEAYFLRSITICKVLERPPDLDLRVADRTFAKTDIGGMATASCQTRNDSGSPSRLSRFWAFSGKAGAR